MQLEHLIPPFIALIIAFLTRNVYWSLIAGVFASGLVVSHGDILFSVKFLFMKAYANSEIGFFFEPENWGKFWNVYIVFFLLSLGAIIQLIHESGAATAYKNFVLSITHSKKNVQIGSLILSKFLFLDDYFSTLTVGSVMRPITDSFRIPRVKLAFLVDSLAAPLAILCPVSSWVAAIVGFMRSSGISQDATALIHGSPFVAYIHTLPFIFYSFFVVVFCWAIVCFGWSFGNMKRFEDITEQTNDPLAGKPGPLLLIKTNEQGSNTNGGQARFVDFVFPIITLFLFTVIGLLISGGWGTVSGLGMIDSLRNAHAGKGLFTGSFASLIVTACYLRGRGLASWKKVAESFYLGAKLMVPAAGILFLAWTFGDSLRNELSTGQAIANLMIGSFALDFLPTTLFITATMVAFTTGTTWGTASIMFPLVVDVILSFHDVKTGLHFDQVPDLFICLGAVLSGGIAGNHVSPISDTTFMAASSTCVNQADHVNTQFTYTLPLIFFTALAYLLLGFTNSWSFSLGVSMLVGLGFFQFKHYMAHKNS